MGWWKVEGTDNLIGDRPLDALTGAVAEVADAYRAAFNRLPTKAEWAALLIAVLGAEEPEEKVVEDGEVISIRVT